MSTLTAPVARRRTFAIISHPDAGKTTLTEKLLLFGGAIQLAGEVKAKRNRVSTRSDWMNIERERGISVVTSVMTFEYADRVFNLLDTPGHEDFSEDTYRTLTAVDSAVMVIDGARGIEARTRKLFEVCRLRDIPIVTFINKMDRESRDPFDLLDEIEKTLALDTAPVTWPIGRGQHFAGTYDLRERRVRRLDADAAGTPVSGPDDPACAGLLPEHEREAWLEEVMLAEDGCRPFDLPAFREGHLTPVFFGSALKNFGVRDLIDALAAIAPQPRGQPADTRTVVPDEAGMTGFVFKIQANMDPNHRDRIAMLRVCSGRFRRGMKLKVQNTGKQLSVNSPIMFMASDRELAEEAYAGDVIGIPNHGVLRVGDSLSESGQLRFAGLPNFAPEILQRVRVKDPLKAKHLSRALESLAEEGVTQLFRPEIGADFIVGAVGPLQFEVMADRLASEFNLEVIFEPSPFAEARWLGGDKADLEDFAGKHRGAMARDLDAAPVFLAKSSWETSYVSERYPKVALHRTKERG